ncbi:MAG: hypothetical protein IKO99_14725 [Bacteroidales bacterium]|nr:hypothetical protein [Bacteroidales bacterium]
MKTMTKPHLKSILSSLDSTQIVWAIKFLTDILAGKNIETKTTIIKEDKKDEENESQEGGIPDPKPVWWDYPISPTVLAMRPKKRILISDSYKEELYKALEEKYR